MALTPEQFNKLAAKEDLNYLEEKIDRKVTQKMDCILDAADGLAKEMKNWRDESAVNIAAYDRFEKRITRVENTLNFGSV